MINELNKIFNQALKESNYEFDAKIIISNRKELCDYQFDGVFKLASIYKDTPEAIGNKIVNTLKSSKEYDYFFKDVSFVKPGFINITLSDVFINDYLTSMYSKDKYNIKMPEKIETYVMDYGGPNVAKPLHVGHMRTAIVGESIKRIIRFFNQKVISDVHLGDYGLQIGEVIYGIKKEGLDLDKVTITDLERIYPQMSLLCKENDDIKEECATITKDLQDGSETYQEYFKKIRDISVADIKRLYNYLDVSFDYWYGESDSYNYIPLVEQTLNKQGLIVDSEGAKVINVLKDDDKKEVPPLIFKKSNGAYLYGTTDLATIYERIEDFNPNYILYVVDNRQSMHFLQVFRAAKLANLSKGTKLEFLGYGTVNGEDGKPYKTRSGNTPKLDSLFNEVKEVFTNSKDTNTEMPERDKDIIVNSILKYADLQNNREKDYIFDINKFSSVVGKTGPYIDYTAVRINKILKNYKKDFTNFGKCIYNIQDRDLRVMLLSLGESLNKAFELRMPSYVASYAYDLCVLVNSFYQFNHIDNEQDKTKQNDWIMLMDLCSKVIKTCLNLLIIDIPESM